MNKKEQIESQTETNDLEQEFEGVYGKYKITIEDKLEVKRYRLAVVVCAASFTSGLLQWLIFGPNKAWIWLIPMSISLGLALQWIHIYIRFIHQTLKAFWGIGSIAILILIFQGDPNELFSNFSLNKLNVLVMGPFFAALTGLGFKEFFCFRKPEAIGVTILLPISLLGYALGILNPTFSMTLISISSILLLTLGVRKFGMDPASDIGDKSVFEYLKSVQQAKTSKI